MSEQEEDSVSVFVSYSHKDQKWLERLMVHLAPLERELQVILWADTKIRPGTQWREEIRAALEKTNIAVLLVSADFLASDFIRKHELPPLLSSAELRGAAILPLIVSPCRFSRTQEISKFQAVNSPGEALIGVSLADQESVFVKLADTIEDLVVAQRAAESRKFARHERSKVSSADANAGALLDQGPDVSMRKVPGSSPERFAYTVDDQFSVQSNEVTSVESFLEKSTWEGLLKIGNWIFDEQGSRIIGAGTKTYLLSQHDYGSSIFMIDTTLEFTNFSVPSRGRLGMNAGILFGWKYDKNEPRYFNVLLTGSTVQIEKCGFEGGRDVRDHKYLTEPVALKISPGERIRLKVEIDDMAVKVSVDDTLLITMNRPEGVVGRVGIRPWRSNVDIKSFVVESF